MDQITRDLKAAACSTESTKQTDHLKAFVLVFWSAPLLLLALFSALSDSNTHTGCMDQTIGRLIWQLTAELNRSARETLR